MARSPRVPDLLAERAATAPTGVAIIGDSGAPLTFGAWHHRARAFAAGLTAAGVRVGDRVALWFAGTHWTDYAVAYFGTLRAGAVAVPLSPRLTAPEAAAAMRAAGCAALVTGGAVPEARVEPGTWRASCVELERGSGHGQALAGPGSELAEILHTSGTTGAPKLIAASHENVLAGWTPGGSAAHDPAQFFVHAAPIATNSGQVSLLSPLREPFTSVVMASFDARRYCDLLARYRAVHTLLVPATARWLVDSGAYTGVDLSCVRTVVLTSAAAAPGLLADVAAVFAAATVTNIYTSTEAWPAMTAMDYDPRRPGSVGRPESGQQVRVLAGSGEPAEVGATGEVALHAGGLAARSYLGDPPLEGPAFAGGWVRTGDLGYLDGDGYLYLVGRRSEMINAGGLPVSPAEVEAALEEHPAVAEAGVAGVAHPVLGEVVVAAVVTRAPISGPGLGDWLRGRLAEHKRPARIVFVDRLPRNALEKVARPELRQLLTGALDERMPSGTGTPRTADERILLRLWCEVLGRSDIGVDDDFIAIGGHSLAAFEIAARAGQALGVDVPREFILTTPTVASQAEAVRRLRQATGERPGMPSPASVPIRRRSGGDHGVR
jgi:acyl-CoA synthetase (AMP-forming)/AMP-acid ligase II